MSKVLSGLFLYLIIAMFCPYMLSQQITSFGIVVKYFHFVLILEICELIGTIRKTSPCNEHPLNPTSIIVKLEYAGVYLFFLFLLQNIDCVYSLEPPRRGGSNVYPQSMF